MFMHTMFVEKAKIKRKENVVDKIEKYMQTNYELKMVFVV